MTLATPRGSMRRSTFYGENLGEGVEPSGLGTWANGDLYEIIQDLAETLSHLQSMAKGHEVRMATIVSAVLQTSQDRDSGVPERLQSLESSVAALSESVARQQVARVAERPSVVKPWRNPVLLSKRGNARRLSSAASRLHWRRCLNVQSILPLTCSTVIDDC